MHESMVQCYTTASVCAVLCVCVNCRYTGYYYGCVSQYLNYLGLERINGADNWRKREGMRMREGWQRDERGSKINTENKERAGRRDEGSVGKEKSKGYNREREGEMKRKSQLVSRYLVPFQVKSLGEIVLQLFIFSLFSENETADVWRDGGERDSW